MNEKIVKTQNYKKNQIIFRALEIQTIININ